MKKGIALLIGFLLIFALVACKTTTTTTTSGTTTGTTSTTTTTTTHTTTTTTTTTGTTTTTTTTTAPEDVTTVVIHYFNEAGNYDNFGVWLWTTGVDGAEYAFTGIDAYGAYLELDMTASPFTTWESVEFIIKSAGSWTWQTANFAVDWEDTTNDRIDAYYVHGAETFSLTYEAPTMTKVFIHYNKTLRAVELFNVKAWGQDAGGAWLADYYVEFTEEDAWGAVAIIDLVANGRASLGFAIIPGTTFEPDASQVDSVDAAMGNPNGEVHIYIVSGSTAPVYGSAPIADLIDITLKYVPIIKNGGTVSEVVESFDDFARPLIAQTGVSFTGNAALSSRINHLRVNYTATNGVTTDASIYKAASAANTLGQYGYLVFVMKGLNGASIDDLKLGFRLDDNHQVLVLDFSELLDPDLAALPEFDGDYQVYVIDILNTLDGRTFVGTTANDVAAGGSIVGFHLMADGLGEGTVDIQSVYYSSNEATVGPEATDYLLDDFQRTNVSGPNTQVYWCGSVGEIVAKWLVLDATLGAVMYEDNSHPLGTFENIILSLRSSVAAGDIYVTPVYKDGETITYGTKVLLSTLINPDGVAIGTLGTAFAEVAISIAQNGWLPNLAGLKFELDAFVVTFDYIQYKTFFEVDLPEYPALDLENLIVFDNFGRGTVGATAAYDPNNPVAAANNLYYIISYTNSEAAGKLYIEDNAIVFDCTTDTGYINFVEASMSGVTDTHKYLVFKLKVDQGGSLANFRFQLGTNPVTYVNDLFAVAGLKSVNSPYISADGWTYVVIDLELNDLPTMVSEITLYWSDGGRLLIDNIFFANDDFSRVNQETKTIADNVDGIIVYNAGPDYQYNHIGLQSNNPLNQRYLVFVIRGTGLNNFRFATYDGAEVSGVKYITDLVGFEGYQYQLTDFPADEYRYLVIDLFASGLNPNPDGIHLHLNDAQIFIQEIFFADTFLPEINPAFVGAYEPTEPTVIDGSAAGYLYNYIYLGATDLADYMVFTVKGDLTSIRFDALKADGSSAAGVIWMSDLIGQNGLPLAYQPTSVDYQTLVVDLAASGLGNDVMAMHLHYGNDSATDILTIQSIKLLQKVKTSGTDIATLADVYRPEVAQVIDGSAAGYLYNYIGFTTPVLGERYLVLTVKGQVTSLRFEAIHADDTTVAVKWIHELKGVDGNTLVYEENTVEYQTLVIDLVASGIGTDIKGMHFHYGTEAVDDILTILSFEKMNAIDITADLAAVLVD